MAALSLIVGTDDCEGDGSEALPSVSSRDNKEAADTPDAESSPTPESDDASIPTDREEWPTGPAAQSAPRTDASFKDDQRDPLGSIGN